METVTIKSKSLNPTERLPVEVVENILQHLRGKDLIRSSFVNWEWNEQIGLSLRCMKKLELRIGSEWNLMTVVERKEILMSRKYQNARISEVTEFSGSLFKLLSLRSTWWSITIRSTEFPTTTSFIKFVETFAATVETLEMYGITIKKHDAVEPLPELCFNRLKFLTISNCDDIIYTHLFHHCPLLKSLKMYNPKETFTNAEGIISMLKCHKDLKKLHFDKQWSNIIFSVYPEFPFHIDDFSITNYSPLFNIVDGFLMEFLKSQQNNIRYFQLGDLLGANFNVLRQTFAMQALKEIIIFHLPYGNTRYEMERLELATNKSIEKFDIMTVDLDNKIPIVKTMLKAMPNVKKIIMRSITPELAQIMVDDLKCLEKVVVLQLVSESIEEMLPMFQCRRMLNITEIVKIGKK